MAGGDQITAIEDAIIARLQAILQQPGLSAAALTYPDKNFDEYEPIHGNGEILVVYTGEDDGPTEDTGLVVQEREMLFELTFLFSSLRAVGKTGGLNAHLEASRMGLTGYKPDGCTKKMTLVSVDRVKRYKKRWWQYTQIWKAVAMNVEILEEEQPVYLTRATAFDNGIEKTLEVP